MYVILLESFYRAAKEKSGPNSYILILSAIKFNKRKRTTFIAL